MAGTDLIVTGAGSVAHTGKDRVRDATEPHKTGPKPVLLLPDFVYECGKLHMTQAEVGALCGLSQSRVSERFKEDEELRAAWDHGRAEGAQSLRRWQFDAAEKGNVVAQIWLGKQVLGQKDAVKEIEQTNTIAVVYEAVWGGRHADEVEAPDEDGPVEDAEYEEER